MAGAGSLGEEVSYPLCSRNHKKLSALNKFAAEDSHLGASLALLGDVDGNGVDDIAVGIPGDSHGLSEFQNAGSILIVLRKKDGGVKKAYKWPTTLEQFELAKGDRFGWSMASIEDLDRDGVRELVVGIRGYDHDGKPDSGAIATLFLNSDGEVKSWALTTAKRVQELAELDEFGSAVANIGDINGDKIDDLAVGAHKYDGDKHVDAGCVYVCAMQRDGKAESCTRVFGSGRFTYPDLDDFNYFGASIASIGDVDGNGVVDLAVGAWGHAGSGAVFLLHMMRDTNTKTLRSENYLKYDSESDIDFFKSGVNVGWSLSSGTLGIDGRRWLSIGDDSGTQGYGSIGLFTIRGKDVISLVTRATVSTGIGGGPTLDEGGRFGSSVLFLENDDRRGKKDDIFHVAVGARWDKDVDNAAGVVFDLTLGPFKSDRCHPQLLVPPPHSTKKNSSRNKGESSLSEAVVIGISIAGAIVGCMIVCCLVFFCLAQKRKSEEDKRRFLHQSAWSNRNTETADEQEVFLENAINNPPQTTSLEGVQLRDCDGDIDADLDRGYGPSRPYV